MVASGESWRLATGERASTAAIPNQNQKGAGTRAGVKALVDVTFAMTIFMNSDRRLTAIAYPFVNTFAFQIGDCGRHQC